jgi:hypothetical protein
LKSISHNKSGQSIDPSISFLKKSWLAEIRLIKTIDCTRTVACRSDPEPKSNRYNRHFESHRCSFLATKSNRFTNHVFRKAQAREFEPIIMQWNSIDWIRQSLRSTGNSNVEHLSRWTYGPLEKPSGVRTAGNVRTRQSGKLLRSAAEFRFVSYPYDLVWRAARTRTAARIPTLYHYRYKVLPAVLPMCIYTRAEQRAPQQHVAKGHNWIVIEDNIVQWFADSVRGTKIHIACFPKKGLKSFRTHNCYRRRCTIRVGT